MNYKNYEIEELGPEIVVHGVEDFNATHTFECGQCFRWTKEPDGSYSGIVKSKVINVKVKDNSLYIANTNLQDFKEIWFDYFDLGTDYSEIKSRLALHDDTLKVATEHGWGIRLLKQDLWELLISFILSARNSIPSIMKSVEKLSEMYGDVINFRGENFYSFPSAENLASACLSDILLCKGSFRCKYIHQAAYDVLAAGMDSRGLSSLNTDSARKELMRFKGVGPKVADCVLLFSGLKPDVFPTDLWIKRIMEEIYFKRTASFKEIQDFASREFGDLSGIAQQYLFYYARQNKIGVD